MKAITIACTAGVLLAGSSASAQLIDLSWRTFDAGGGVSLGANFTLEGTIGQHDAGTLSGFGYELGGGFWPGISQSCYANCDLSTASPVLNVGDFGCFLTKFASGDPYANCDGSTSEPVLNVADFGCFLSKFAAGCP